MKKHLLHIIFLMSVFSVQAEERTCVSAIEAKFFDPLYVSQALSLHDVSQSAWSEVNRRLRERIATIPQLVVERASKMAQDPFKSPFQPHEAAQVLQKVLLELFASVLLEFNIQDPYEVREMFNYIRAKQNMHFVTCFGEEENTF